ncbi:hypothetical protein [Dapis sp. BLCC M172]|uniref:hypothetical protein n=1 Tax=Dapis sp. BLCC M172 TaxID=2975281 RepID=UPI003CF2761D
MEYIVRLSRKQSNFSYQLSANPETRFLEETGFLCVNTIRYIHANPKTAGMKHGFFYDFSNYGSYEQLTTDGITQWHPAFFELGSSLEECTDKYKWFCRRYKPRKKLATVSDWGKRILRGILSIVPKTKVSPGQIPLPFLVEKIVLIVVLRQLNCQK